LNFQRGIRGIAVSDDFHGTEPALGMMDCQYSRRLGFEADQFQIRRRLRSFPGQRLPTGQRGVGHQAGDEAAGNGLTIRIDNPYLAPAKGSQSHIDDGVRVCRCELHFTKLVDHSGCVKMVDA
jgi:hypothetical protein